MFKFLNDPKSVAIILLVIIGAAILFKKSSPHQAPLNSTQVTALASQPPLVIPRPVALPRVVVAEKVQPSVASSESKLQILQEILGSRNDNDPRIDLDLKILDSETKKQFRNLYSKLAPEDRNDRGTIVFLLGRNLTEPEDFEFFQNVIGEELCLSLQNCRSADEESFSDEPQSEVALNYPQAVLIDSLNRYMTDHPSIDPQTYQHVVGILDRGSKSKGAYISQASQTLLKKL